MKRTITILAAALALSTSASASLIISQYIETNSGATPKGIELWNTGSSAIDFSATDLDVLVGFSGAALASHFTLTTGTLAAGDVMVIGTADLGTYLDTTFGSSVILFSQHSFGINGDDALQIQLNSVVQDTFGNPGQDPGNSWNVSGVDTRNNNLALKEGINIGDTDGWTNPSVRFEEIAVGTNMTGFGVAPIPEPGISALLGGLLALGAVMVRRRR